MNTLIFLHIPKNAGTSLRKIIERFYKEENIYRIYTRSHGFNDINDFLKLPDIDKKKIKLIYGHISFGLHQHVPQPCSYVTMLRNPVDRIISLFHHVSNDPNHPYYVRIRDEKLSIGQFVRMGVAASFETDNHQTRIISGEFPEYGKCTAGILEKAKDNLRDKFSCIGLAERFGESVLAMKEIMEWEDSLFKRIRGIFSGGKLNESNIKINVSNNRMNREDIQQDDLKAILEFNSLDMELYSYAESLFKEQVTKKRKQD